MTTSKLRQGLYLTAFMVPLLTGPWTFSANADLWRVDFESPITPNLMTGNETMAAAVSSRFNSPMGVWNGPNNAPDNANFTMSLGPPFSFPLVEATGGTSIQMGFTGGTARVASTRILGLMPALYADMWTVDLTNNGVPGSVNEFLEWELTGLAPNAAYEMFAYGGWPDASFPFEVDEDIVYWIDKDADGDFTDDPLLEVGLGPIAGPHGDHITGIMSNGSGAIRGRWKGDPNTGFIGHTQGFQLAHVPEPASLLLVVSGALGLWLRKRAAEHRHTARFAV